MFRDGLGEITVQQRKEVLQLPQLMDNMLEIYLTILQILQKNLNSIPEYISKICRYASSKTFPTSQLKFISSFTFHFNQFCFLYINLSLRSSIFSLNFYCYLSLKIFSLLHDRGMYLCLQTETQILYKSNCYCKTSVVCNQRRQVCGNLLMERRMGCRRLNSVSANFTK